MDSNQRPLGPEPSVLPLNYPGARTVYARVDLVNKERTVGVAESGYAVHSTMALNGAVLGIACWRDHHDLISVPQDGDHDVVNLYSA